MNKIKGHIYIIIILSILIIGFIIIYLLNNMKVQSNNTGNTLPKLNTSETEKCDHEPQIYYDAGTRKIFTYCLDSIKIKLDDELIEFKDYLSSNENIIDEIMNNLILKTTLFDGGTEIYKDGGTKKYSSKGITLIKCNTIEGNRDIYIGNKYMEYKSNFCKDNTKTFTRTYTIEAIEEYNDQQFENGIPVTYGKSLKVRLSQFQGDTKTVILNNIMDNLIKGNTYEFELMLYQDAENITDDIEYIFKNSSIIEIRQTSKLGLDQRQDAIK